MALSNPRKVVIIILMVIFSCYFFFYWRSWQPKVPTFVQRTEDMPSPKINSAEPLIEIELATAAPGPIESEEMAKGIYSSGQFHPSHICLLTMVFRGGPELPKYNTVVNEKKALGFQRMSMQNFKYYSRIHGYPILVVNSSLDSTRPLIWTKVKAVQQVIESKTIHCDWIAWLDVDTLIMNMSIPLESFIDEDFHVILSRNFQNINLGVFLTKRTEFAAQFWQEVWDTNTVHEWWQEQSGVISVYPKYPQYVKALPATTLQSTAPDAENGDYKPGHFLIHYAGLSCGPSPESCENLVGPMASIAKKQAKAILKED
eukprot:TRINITY_DN2859_c0_g1_i2.p1 TRINITY_DN2859_c0_g1~~TRINITY_DN2859_c0_g1_i2.p1  ORF type:complete len:315 (+),score=49.00 TRINITY_DN2859_c0_g1_i2:43-987(+)